MLLIIHWSGSCEKVVGVTVSTGLLNGGHSRARSHYCPTWGLLVAGSPLWPDSLLLRQPGSGGFIHRTHVDARLSADACSTWPTAQQNPRTQVILYNWPPRRRVIEARQAPGRRVCNTNWNYIIWILFEIFIWKLGYNWNYRAPCQVEQLYFRYPSLLI